MRIFAANAAAAFCALACLIAAPAMAQDFPPQIEAAERERDASMAAVDAAIQANDWAAACTRAKDATARQRAIANTASDWVDQQDASRALSEDAYRRLSLRVGRLYQLHAELAEADAGICAKAAG